MIWKKQQRRNAANIIADAVFAKKEADLAAARDTLAAARENGGDARETLVNSIARALDVTSLQMQKEASAVVSRILDRET